MSKIVYVNKRFSAEVLGVIEAANEIIADFEDAGFDLSLRQLYYQFVSRGLIPNTEQSYKRLGSIINDARLAGLIDWERLVDRTRELDVFPAWTSPRDILRIAAASYRVNPWKDQTTYVEVWVEKQALIDVVKTAVTPFRVPHFACRGYVSQSEMWTAAQRFIANDDKHCVLVYLGDHDPSGIDMTRDIRERMELFGADVTVTRLALTMRQVMAYDPPPNPAKVTDSRYESYRTKFGEHSWELDALNPATLVQLIQKEVKEHIDSAPWEAVMEREEVERKRLVEVAENF